MFWIMLCSYIIRRRSESSKQEEGVGKDKLFR